MSETTLQDILPLVQMPSRYLGSEVNRIIKSWKATRLHIALAFPDLYEIASSHFGIQILYAILNDQADILAERVFAPAVDMEAQLRINKLELCSLESQSPLKKFDIVGFSLLYELNYTNVLNMLDLGGIEFFAHRRTDNDPFVIAGGPCTCNPEPVAEFFDAIVVGDGETVILQMADAWKAWRQTQNRSRETLLQQWSQLKGVYIPSYFRVSSDNQGRQQVVAKKAAYPYVERAVVADLNDAPFPSTPIIPFGRPVHDRLRMEIARGCTRGCRFCQAGMIYRPVRERRPEAILSLVSQALKQTGYEDLSLLSLSTGDYSCIAPLMNRIMQFGEKDRVAVSLPSLRAGSLTPELMALIRKVRKTGFTIAPEAGSQRLRDVINKNISEADIVATVENAFALGWKLIKLYFMIGLPTEQQADIEAIVVLVKQLKSLIRKRGKINVSITTFVPKAHTPFQWEPQISLESAMEKINWLKANLSLSGVHVKWQDPRVSVIEGVWARGDRRLNEVLINAWKNGCRFDGWTDFFDYDRWVSVFKKSDLNPYVYTQGCSDHEQALPWEHIHIGVARDFLVSEKVRALAEEITPDCRTGACGGCGVCDFDTLNPVSFHHQTDKFPVCKAEVVPEMSEKSEKYLIPFKKIGSARFLGHLEMAKILTRCFRRARLPLKYSQGFHPMPKVSFGDTLPMGMQSEEERMLVTLTENVDTQELFCRLERQLPSGLEINACLPYKRQDSLGKENQHTYAIELKDGFFMQKALDWFFDQKEVEIQRKRKQGQPVVIDLKKAIRQIQILDGRRALMTLEKVENILVRPARVMSAIFKLNNHQIFTAIITKQKTNHV